MKKVLQRSLLVLGGLMVIVLLLGLKFVWRSPAHYANYENIDLPVQIMTSDQYDHIVDTHPRPYIITIETSQSEALFQLASIGSIVVNRKSWQRG